ncbi:MAG: glycoside hydrolase family 95 protein [Clostridiales bacterium]|nr:glycoside hydrolase family 95 protein [Clostridiales bacterium]
MASSSTTGWQQGYPVGNGYISGVIYDEDGKIRITVCGEKLFVPWNSVKSIPDMSDAMEKARLLILDGREQEAADEFYKAAMERGMRADDSSNISGYPNCFHPACEIVIEPDFPLRDASLSLDFMSGETAYLSCGLTIRLFASFTEPVIYALIQPDADSGFSLSMRPVPNESPYVESKTFAGILSDRYLSHQEISYSENKISINGRYPETGGWRLEAEISSEGEISRDGGRLRSKSAPALTAIHFDDLDMPRGEPVSAYEALLRKNAPAYRAAVGTASLELEGGEEDTDNETLLLAARNGDIRPALIERAFCMGAYLTASSSGDIPPHALGRWIPSADGHIFGDYVWNMEVEECLWPAYDRKMERSLDSLEKLIKRDIADWRENARGFYGARGILIACRTTDNGLLTHFSPKFPHQFWTAGAAWLSFMLYDRWMHSMDIEYLKHTALPFMEEAAAFYYETLKQDDHGKWVFCPSYSPENKPSNKSARATMAAVNASMDIFFVKTLCQCIAAARKTLNMPPMEEAEMLLSRIPDYMIGSGGELREWADERYDDNPYHRHLSHLVCAYPLFLAQDDEKLFKAASKALKNRLDANLGNEGCGWSWGHILNIAARLREKETVELAVNTILSAYERTNLVTTLWPKKDLYELHEPHQTDCACAVSAGLIESLAFSRPGMIRFLPAWPYGSGTLTGVCLRGNIRLHKMTWNESELTAVLEAEDDTEAEIFFPDGFSPVSMLIRLPANEAVCLSASR